MACAAFLGVGAGKLVAFAEGFAGEAPASPGAVAGASSLAADGGSAGLAEVRGASQVAAPHAQERSQESSASSSSGADAAGSSEGGAGEAAEGPGANDTGAAAGAGDVAGAGAQGAAGAGDAAGAGSEGAAGEGGDAGAESPAGSEGDGGAGQAGGAGDTGGETGAAGDQGSSAGEAQAPSSDGSGASSGAEASGAGDASSQALQGEGQGGSGDSGASAASSASSAPASSAASSSSSSASSAQSSASSRSSSSSSSSSSYSSSSSSSSKDEEDEKKKAEEAEEAIEKARKAAEEAKGKLSALDPLLAQLAPYPQLVQEQWAGVQAFVDARVPLDEQRVALFDERDAADKQRAQALYGLLLADAELARTGGADIFAVLLEGITATQAEEQGYYLTKVAANRADAVAAAEGWRDATDASIADVDAQIADAVAAYDAAVVGVRETIDAGNAVAFEIEKVCAEARQESKEANDAVQELDDKVEGVEDAKREAAAWDLRGDATRSQAQNAVGAYYDTVEGLAGMGRGITFGSGIEFALPEDEFVARWGAAIDAYLASYSMRLHVAAPLGGYGQVMAKWAYAYKLDPRLCAAVSIAESSGGTYCIKPHNAWGWGAADRDPYGLASAWGSWESAIESWTRGVATSTAGYATAGALSRFGDIYCSTPIWGKRVATYMEEISSFYSPASE